MTKVKKIKRTQSDRPDLGILEWFHFEKRDFVERTLGAMRKLGARRLRTGVSWADWYRDGGQEWYAWLFDRLAREEGLEVLPCFTYTPPSLGEVPVTSSPPRDLSLYANFVDQMVAQYGETMEYVELWNEPNNQAEWDYTRDPHWTKFAEMIGGAAHWIKKEHGKKIVLGGMSPIDPGWLEMMFERDLMKLIDVVGVHGFPHTWEKGWTSWDEQVGRVRQVLDEHGWAGEVWLTEVGYSTRNYSEYKQLKVFDDALRAPVDRIYWYGMYDLAAEQESVLGLHVDEREYHCGLRCSDDRPKLLYRIWEEEGPAGVSKLLEWETAPEDHPEGATLITGGAGFVGSNLADRLASEGRDVVILDNLSRPGVEENARWLLETHGDKIHFVPGDVRDQHLVRTLLPGIASVFHFAGQVAVTTSLVDPRGDFSANALGTLNVLEAIRALPEDERPSLVFTSTNKVYGGLDGIEMLEEETRWVPADDALRERGVGLDQQVSLRSPYGCSKGAADQYVLDYALTYGLPAAVFRMSCIYGPRQFGTEDQGWVAHFVLQAIDDRPITIFGDGKQVRDILFVHDLVDAFLAAEANIDELAGRAFNIGGGPTRTVSLLELLELIGEADGRSPQVGFEGWRPGDQRYYVSDTSAFEEATGWAPSTSVAQGVEQLYRWLREFRGQPVRPAAGAARAVGKASAAR